MTPTRLTPDEIIAEIQDLFDRHGGENYGEDVTQLEHAVQVGLLAEAAGEPDEVVIAAFLHDIGHLCGTDAEMIGTFGRRCHDSNGGGWARSRGFPEKVARLIENHVAAKRYLTATDPAYNERLSAASKATLLHQGGPMNVGEIAEFERDELHPLHIRLRHWDEAGKDDSADLTDVSRFLERIRAVLARE
jgi:putative nucleotidyltransferase with HDIG domain